MGRRLVVLVSVFILFSASNVFAHPPAKIDLSFLPGQKLVEATIYHPVSNPNSHFIDKVAVAVNGKEVLVHKVSIQDDNEKQVVIYRIPDVKEGDIISVEADCNKSGKLKKELEIKLK